MKNTFLICYLFFLAACSNVQKTEVSEAKMIDVIYDLTVSSSARNTANRRDTLQYVVSYQEILKKHGLDSLQFVKAQKVYQQNPELYSAIYDSVINRLKVKLEEIRKTKSEEDEVLPVVNLKEVSFSQKKK